MRKTKAQKWDDVHKEALRRFGAAYDAVRYEREQCIEDRKFAIVAGAQWEGALGDQFENRPKLEVNKVHLSVLRVLNEYLNNRITVDFVSKTGEPGSDQLADLCDGLYRADELDSGSDEAQDNAFAEAVFGGFGAWRLCTQYEDEENDDNDYQRVRFEPIFDADSTVYFDPDCKRQDKRNAKYAFLLTPMSPEAYEEEYDDAPTTWQQPTMYHGFDWATAKNVYVAEYYVVEAQKVMRETWAGPGGETEKYDAHELDEVEESDDETEGASAATLRQQLEATGWRMQKSRSVKRQRVRKWILSGGGVIEDCGYIAGKYIPIVPVYGKRFVVSGAESCAGHVRLTKDAQRLKNMQISHLAMISAGSSVEKPIFDAEQIAGHQDMWETDSLQNYTYLLVNKLTNEQGQKVAQGPLGYTKSPNIPPAMAALLQLTEQDMRDVLGNQESAEQMQPNLSGKAVELIQNKLDMQSYIYMANMAKAVKRCGEIWLSMAKEIMLDDGRKVKTIDQSDKPSYETLRESAIEEKSGARTMRNDLSKAAFDLVVDVGPSSNSRRASTVRNLTALMAITPDPETQQVLGSVTLANMDGEGMGDVREYYRAKLVRLGVFKPTKEEAALMKQQKADQPPDPQQEYLKAAAQEAASRAAKANADTALSMAKTELTRAQTVETLAGVDRDDNEQVFGMTERAIASNRPQPAP